LAAVLSVLLPSLIYGFWYFQTFHIAYHTISAIVQLATPSPSVQSLLLSNPSIIYQCKFKPTSNSIYLKIFLFINTKMSEITHLFLN
jgi:hypothetical protein